MKSKLYLIPNFLGESLPEMVLPSGLSDIIKGIRYFIVENERTARRFLKKINPDTCIDDLTFFLLNEHTDKKNISDYLEPAKEGNSIGIISEAGVPGVADPGAEIVAIAHGLNIQVVPLVGPSSILLSLMASGLCGQNFAFIGYLPVRPGDRIRQIKKIEQTSLTEKQTQIFIETPYRNMALLKDLINVCHPATKLCIASNLTTEEEFVKTKTVSEWKRNIPDLHKKPTVFLLKK